MAEITLHPSREDFLTSQQYKWQPCYAIGKDFSIPIKVNGRVYFPSPISLPPLEKAVHVTKVEKWLITS